MTTNGIPPGRLWPYKISSFHKPPDAWLYSYVEPYRSIRYVRLDARNRQGSETLEVVKSFLAAGFPCDFGFSVPSSLSAAGEIPYRPSYDVVRGGQAMVANGYDDEQIMGGTRGALLVRSSWGSEWGEQGHGWLPYAYVTERLAISFWTLFRKDWLESGEFKRPEFLG